jgi:hypothetical protein
MSVASWLANTICKKPAIYTLRLGESQEEKTFLNLFGENTLETV